MAKIEVVKQCVLELIEENPTITWTVRQMYYRLVSPPYQIIPNKRSAYTLFDRQLVKLRESGEIPDSVFVDTARRIEGGDVTDWNVDEYFEVTIRQLEDEYMYFTKSRWTCQDYFIIVVLEKDALSRLVEQVTNSFYVPLAIGRGYSSRTQVLEIADMIEKYYAKGKKVAVLYLGDFDPTGLDIERSLEERLRNELCYDITVRRIALTYEQAKGLPPNPTKSADPRANWYVSKYGDECWELDALPPQELKDIVRDTIEEYIDMDKWNEVEKEEEAGQEKLRAMFKRAVELLRRNFLGGKNEQD